MTCRQCILVRLDQYVNHDPSLYSRPGLYLRPGLYSRKYSTSLQVESRVQKPSGINLVQKSGKGHECEARRAKASWRIGLRGGRVLGNGMCPLPPAREYGGALQAPPVGSGAKSRRPRDFCGLWYSGSHPSCNTVRK